MKNKKIFIIVGTLIFMALYTFVVYNIMFSPKEIFSKGINKAVKKINENIEEINFKNTMTDINVKFNTSLQDLKAFANYTYGVKFGTDSKNKTAETKVYMVDQNNKEYSYTGYIKNSNLYHKLSSLDTLILYNIENQDLTSVFETTGDISSEELKYLIKVASKSIIKNFNKKNFSKKSNTITIGKNKIKVTKNTYEINSKEYVRMTKAVYNDIYNDSKAIKIITSLTGKTKEELKKEIDEIKEYVNQETIRINVYNKFNKILGFDIDENEKVIISYYKNNDDFIINYDNYNIEGIKKNKNLVVTVKEGINTHATLTFNKYKRNDFAFDFITDSYTGNISCNREKNKNVYKTKLDIMINDGKNTYSFNIKENQEKNAKIANIDTNNAVKYTEEEFAEALTTFVNSLKDTPLSFVSEMFMPSNNTQYYEY
ncbi:MAG: hypothetical protein IKG27_04030 [Bacilli bacterium]|nr:hypothetical protein [Bacilli bacterium]